MHLKSVPVVYTLSTLGHCVNTEFHLDTLTRCNVGQCPFSTQSSIYCNSTQKAQWIMEIGCPSNPRHLEHLPRQTCKSGQGHLTVAAFREAPLIDPHPLRYPRPGYLRNLPRQKATGCGCLGFAASPLQVRTTQRGADQSGGSACGSSLWEPE